MPATRISVLPSSPAPDKVPLQIAAGLVKVLNGAINDANRRNKREKFCAETSEDAVTWTVFRWLHQEDIPRWCRPCAGSPRRRARRRCGSGARRPEEERPNGSGSGTSRFRMGSASSLAVEPRSTRCSSGTTCSSAVEVKYKSRNDRKSGRTTDLGATFRPTLFAADVESVDELGFYELARNWALGSALAEALDRRFLLVNLGPQRWPGTLSC